MGRWVENLGGNKFVVHSVVLGDNDPALWPSLDAVAHEVATGFEFICMCYGERARIFMSLGMLSMDGVLMSHMERLNIATNRAVDSYRQRGIADPDVRFVGILSPEAAQAMLDRFLH